MLEVGVCCLNKNYSKYLSTKLFFCFYELLLKQFIFNYIYF